MKKSTPSGKKPRKMFTEKRKPEQHADLNKYARRSGNASPKKK